MSLTMLINWLQQAVGLLLSLYETTINRCR